MQKKEKSMVITAIVLAVFFTGIYTFNHSTDRNFRRQLYLGDKYLETADYDGAILAFQTAVNIDPKSTEAYLGLANTYEKQAESYDADETDKIIDAYNQSAKAYEASISLKAEDIDAYLPLINMYKSAEEAVEDTDEEAAKDFQEKAADVAERAKKIDPTDKTVRSVLDRQDGTADGSSADGNTNSSSVDGDESNISAGSEKSGDEKQSNDFSNLSYTITREDQSSIVTANDGTSVTIPIYYDLLQITDDSYPYKDKVNAILQKNKDEFFKNAESSISAMKDIIPTLTPGELSSFGYYYELTEDKVSCYSDILSIDHQSYYHIINNGADVHSVGTTIDLRTGTILTLPQVLHKSVEECQQLIFNGAIAQVGTDYLQSSEYFLDESRYDNFYIDPDGHVYYVVLQYELFAGCVGSVPVDLGSFTGLNDPSDELWEGNTMTTALNSLIYFYSNDLDNGTHDITPSTADPDKFWYIIAAYFSHIKPQVTDPVDYSTLPTYASADEVRQIGYELFPDCTDIPPLSDNGLVEKSEDSTDSYYFGAGDYGDYECTLISHTKDDNGAVDAVFSLATHEGEYARATVHLVQNENNDAASGRFYYRVQSLTFDVSR